MAARKLPVSPDPLQPAGPQVLGSCRVSTDRQADSGISLDEQERKISKPAASSRAGPLSGSWSTPASPAPPPGQTARRCRAAGGAPPGDVVIAAKMDRCFRSAFDALATIEGFKRRKISLWLLDLGGDVSCNGISELIMTVLAAVAQFERSLISKRIKDAERNLRRGNRHQPGKRPFGRRFGESNGHGRARELIPDEAELAAIAYIVAMRSAGATLMEIRNTMHERRHRISHQIVANVLYRRESLGAAA